MKKKVFLLMSLAALSLIHGAAQEYVRMPQALKSGDTIAIISPSSTPTREVVERGCAVLRGWGYVPVVGRHAMNSWHGFAGTAEERAEDLLWALRDSKAQGDRPLVSTPQMNHAHRVIEPLCA